MKQLGDVVDKLGMTKENWLTLLDKSKTDFAAQVSVHDFLNKIVSAIQEGNQVVTDALAPLLVLRHPSQLYAALTEGLLLFLILWFIWYKPRKPGVISALFVIFYAIIRISDQNFRMPDV